LPLETQSDEGIIKGKIDDYISKAVPKLIVSKTEADFTKGYNDMLSHLDEIGLEKYLTKMNDLYKQRKDLWK
jgi:bacterioferritin (cytochrome b1)